METIFNLIKLVFIFWSICFIVACFKHRKNFLDNLYLITRLSVFEKVFYSTILLVLICKTC
jgi:hypothetical protein